MVSGIGGEWARDDRTDSGGLIEISKEPHSVDSDSADGGDDGGGGNGDDS